jgi:hypothetical protein
MRVMREEKENLFLHTFTSYQNQNFLSKDFGCSP